MLPDAKTFWMSVAFLLACGIALIAIGRVWIGVADLVYVRIAKALRAAGAPRRLAWLYDDSGIWLSGLPPHTDLEALPQNQDGWQWIDAFEK